MPSCLSFRRSKSLAKVRPFYCIIRNLLLLITPFTLMGHPNISNSNFNHYKNFPIFSRRRCLMVIAQQPEYRSSVDDQTINSSKPSNKSKNSVHLSATSTSDSMDPPPPAPPPMSSATSGGRTSSPNSNSTGEKKRRPEPPSPVLLRIDASAQGKLFFKKFFLLLNLS